MPKPKITAELLQRVIAREQAAWNEFFGIMTPIFHARIVRVLRRQTRPEIVMELCQDTYVALLDNDGRLAKTWLPTGGESFENFAGRVAQQRALEYLRKERRRREEFLLDNDGNECVEPMTDSSRNPYRLVASQELTEIIFEKAQSRLDKVGQTMLQLLFVEERSVSEVCIIRNMNAAAVYKWRSRIGRLLEEIAHEVGGGE